MRPSAPAAALPSVAPEEGATVLAQLPPPPPAPQPAPPPPRPPAPAAVRAPAPAAAPTAAPAPAPAAAAPRPRPRVKPKEPPPPPGPTPDVKLALEVPTPGGPWLMRVTNAGDVPVRLVADARLLSLEVTPRSASKPLRCQLPVDMRPGDDMERPLVLPPGRSYAELFEPRLYCFGGKTGEALAQGTTVVARLGWPGGNRARPPFEVAPIDGVEPVVAPLRSLESPPVVLPDETPARYQPAPPRAPDDPDPVKLSLRGQASIDATSPNGVSVDVTLRNDGKRPVTVRFRPESLRFNVVTAAGTEECTWPRGPVAPMRELYSTVRPGGTLSLAVMLSDYCERSLTTPGLLLVTPQFDARKSSGEEIGIRSYDGFVSATRPTVVRLHGGRKQTPLVRPHLEGAPQATR